MDGSIKNLEKNVKKPFHQKIHGLTHTQNRENCIIPIDWLLNAKKWQTRRHWKDNSKVFPTISVSTTNSS